MGEQGRRMHWAEGRRGGHGEAGGDSEDEDESGDGMADEEEAVMRRLCATGAAMMHPLEGAAFREVPGTDGGIMVCMTSNCKKTTINLAERTRRSPRSRMMALGMRMMHQVAENGREIKGAPMDWPGSGTPESAFCRPVAPEYSN